VNIEPPSAAEDFESDSESDASEDDRPLTREELAARTLRKLQAPSKSGALRGA
jgi:hypothetical protein